MTQDIFSNGIVRLYHISTTDMKLFSEIVLTSGEKACNIIQVVSEQHNVLQRRQQDIGSQDEKKEQKSS